jgi:hypothetical protein
MPSRPNFAWRTYEQSRHTGGLKLGTGYGRARVGSACRCTGSPVRPRACLAARIALMGVPVRILVGGELSRSHLGASSGRSCHTGSPPCSLTTSLRWLLPVDTDIIEGLEASGSGACLAVAGCRPSVPPAAGPTGRPVRARRYWRLCEGRGRTWLGVWHRTEPPIGRLWMPRGGARLMHQAAKRAGAAALDRRSLDPPARSARRGAS